MQLENFLHFQQPGLDLFSLPMLTIESWWLYFSKFTLQDVSLRPSAMSPNMGHTWASHCPGTCMNSPSGFIWGMMVHAHAP